MTLIADTHWLQGKIVNNAVPLIQKENEHSKQEKNSKLPSRRQTLL